MKVTQTERGFDRADFVDCNGHECSIQKSSAAEQDLLWLGVNEPNPMQFPGNGTGWHPYPLPENVQCTTRMHLTQDNAAELWPLLKKFSETGEIS